MAQESIKAAVPKTPADAKMYTTLTKMIGDMRFVGIMFIIFGILNCLSIIGAVIGIPTIICGLRLREAADGFSFYQNAKDKNSLLMAFEKQGSYFFIQKVLFIIGLCATALVFFIYIIVHFFLPSLKLTLSSFT